MNRKQRRAYAKIPAYRKPEFYELSIPKDFGIPDGAKVTLTGICRRKDGTIDRNCRHGEETVFTVKLDGMT